MEEELFAFVLMPFSSEFDDVYKLAIKEESKKQNIKAERVDEQIYSETILEKIYQQIEAADFIIADMTSRNPNVFYEVGYAHAKGKLCILLTSKEEDIPFDLKHRRHIIYNDSLVSLKTDLANELEWVKRELKTTKASHVKITKISIEGDLQTSKYYAESEIEFKIDFENHSNSISPEIESIYIYTGADSKVLQDNKTCGSTSSDLKPYSQRHLLSFPSRKLQIGQWAQISFKVKKTLASAFLGQEIKDYYRVTGKSNLRLITSKGNFDYEIPVDVVIDNIPF